MFRRLFIVIIFSFFFLKPQEIQGQLSSEMQQCLQSANTATCTTNINTSLASCLKSNVPDKQEGWACADQNRDSVINSADIEICAEDFATAVCNGLNCKADCLQSDKDYLVNLKSLYKEKFSKYQVQQCLKADTSYLRCDTYIENSVIACLSNTLPSQHNIWACEDQDNDRQISSADIKVCSANFSTSICNNLGGNWNASWNNYCRDECLKSDNPYVANLKSLFTDKSSEHHTVEQPIDTVDSSDICLPQITTPICLSSLLEARKCYLDCSSLSGRIYFPSRKSMMPSPRWTPGWAHG